MDYVFKIYLMIDVFYNSTGALSGVGCFCVQNSPSLVCFWYMFRVCASVNLKAKLNFGMMRGAKTSLTPNEPM